MLPWLASQPVPAMAPVAVGDYVVQPRERKLLDTRGQSVPIGSRAFELLLALIDRAGQVVSLDELKELAWPGLVIEPNTLRVHMASLRKALQDNQKEARYIATIPGRGYSLICGADWLGRADGVGADGHGALPFPWPLHAQPRPQRGLPVNHQRVIGQARARAALLDTVLRHRLTTLVAAGGMGKSTLARDVAQAAMQAFDGEVHFVDLARRSGNEASAAVMHGLALASRGRPQGLLVLDNCEHVLDAITRLVPPMAGEGAGCHLLVTSREPLGLPCEQLHWLRPLAIPDEQAFYVGDESALQDSGLALLLERVRACDGGRFQLGPATLVDAIALCRRVGGLPLAIELLADSVARIGLKGTMALSCAEVLALPHPRRTVPERHASLMALMRSSHEALDDAEQAVLRCCGKFEAAFTLEALRAGPCPDVGGLMGLLGKSLIEPALDVGPGYFRVPALMQCFLRASMPGG